MKIKTQAELLALLPKKPYQFLEELVKGFASLEAAKQSRDGEEPVTIDAIIDDEWGDSTLGNIEEYCLNQNYEGLSLNCVLSEGGGEGGGETVVRVYAVVQGATPKKQTREQKKWDVDPGVEGGTVLCYIRTGGYYTSYEGTEWDDSAEIVEPHSVIVTKYFTAAERKKSKEDFVINLAKD